MQLHTIPLVLIMAALTNGAVVQFYSDRSCQTPTKLRNIYDGTCATGTGGYKSFKLTKAGGGNQFLTPWNRDACAGPQAAGAAATDVGVCHVLSGTTAGWNGGANAMSSYSSD